MSILDAHPVAKPGAYWPPGFREWATASARRIAAEDLARAERERRQTARLIIKGIVAAFVSVALTAVLLVAIVGCSPATTRALCDTSAVVLDVAQPASPTGKLAAQVGRFLRAWFCPKTTGATDRLPASFGPVPPLALEGPDGPGQRERLTAAP